MNTFTQAAALAAVVVLIAGGGNARSAEPAGEASPKSGLRSIPVVRIPFATPVPAGERFPFALVNVTDRPIQYLVGGQFGPRWLDISLYQGGKPVRPSGSGPFLRFRNKSHVRTLKPGEAAEGECSFERYGRMKPGRYEVRATYEVAETHSDVRDFGLTPLSFTQTVMMLYIGKATDDSPPKRDLMPTIGKPALRAIPVQRVQSNSCSKATFEYEFENTSKRPFRYMSFPSGERTYILGFGFRLMHDGKHIISQGETHCPIIDKSKVRELAPGKSFVARFLLADYPNLKPGRYELQASYRIGKDDGFVKKFGLTPLEFERTVMILHIVESLPKKLNQRVGFRFKRPGYIGPEEKSHYLLGADVGLGPTWGWHALRLCEGRGERCSAAQHALPAGQGVPPSLERLCCSYRLFLRGPFNQQALCTTSSLTNVPVTEHVEETLRRLGFETERVDYADANGVPKANVVGKKGSGTGGLAYFGHTDVVPADPWLFDDHGPFQPTVKDGRLYGRGSCDMKGSVACMLAAAERFAPNDLQHPLYIVCTADEEVGYGGATQVAIRSTLFREMVEQNARGIIGEPTRLEVVYAHKGAYGFRATSRGKAAHSSTRNGVNANMKMIPFLAEMKALYDEVEADAKWQNLEFDPPGISMNIGVNDHTHAINITPPQSICTVYFRPPPNVDGDAILDRAQAAAESCGVEFELMHRARPVYLDPKSTFVREMLEIADRREPQTVCYGTDGVMFTELKQLLVFGPGDIAQAHTHDEWIALEQLEKGTELYAAAVRRWCCA
jgi:acetylornithine deacetylase